MKIAILITALMMSAFAFVLVSNGGQVTNVNAVVTLGDDDDGDNDDFEEICVGDEGDDGYDEDEDMGDNQDEDGDELLKAEVEIEPTATRNWDGNDDQLEVDDCEFYERIETPTPTVEPSPSPSPSPTSSFNPSSVQNGDANCDGSVTGVDAVSILYGISGTSAASEDCSGADADCSGSVNAGDVARVLYIVAGLADDC